MIQKIVGKTRDVRDETAGKDTTYYQSLLKAKHTVSQYLHAPVCVLVCLSVHACRVLTRNKFNSTSTEHFRAIPTSSVEETGYAMNWYNAH